MAVDRERALRAGQIRRAGFYVVFALLAVLVIGLAMLLWMLMEAARIAEPPRQALIARCAWFTLALLGVAAVLLLWQILRYVRYRWRPAKARPHEYVDAWAEAGRRMQAPAEEDEEPW